MKLKSEVWRMRRRRYKPWHQVAKGYKEPSQWPYRRRTQKLLKAKYECVGGPWNGKQLTLALTFNKTAVFRLHGYYGCYQMELPDQHGFYQPGKVFWVQQ